ncbi:MRG/MORF4L-binding protein-like [Penaeus monodon]|uniref:MRG/MORF4L-binding protein-like n=1 Tax=Penaeus monodon TaxID=6687 RepID=UPI0018A716C7|nr:MRG/MORF4L-binding protein-like [Penaeus monodon]
MLNTKMTDIEWNVENEIQLFYAMMGHKPVGVNKHFQMMIIHDKLSSSLNCELSTQTIWKKLETLYDLAALDESDKLPFPNDENDFSLPDIEFSDLLDERVKPDDKEEKEIRARGRPPKKEDRDKDDVSSRRDRVREVRDEDDDTPRRQGKRGRDSKPSSPAHTPTSNKRRRN